MIIIKNFCFGKILSVTKLGLNDDKTSDSDNAIHWQDLLHKLSKLDPSIFQRQYNCYKYGISKANFVVQQKFK